MSYPTDQFRRILFIDIETATQQALYSDLAPNVQLHWQKKMRHHVSAEEYPTFEEEFSALYHDKGAIYAEFAQVVCISVGYLIEDAQTELSEAEIASGNEAKPEAKRKFIFKVKSFTGESEVDILTAFNALLYDHYYDRFNQFLCGHNIKEFDVPFLCRRSMVHHLKMPNLLNIAGYKPWQVHHLLDTMEMWKFGDYKHYTSLGLLCDVLGVETPKDGMEGSQVSTAYWDGRIDEIVAYCQKDVIATAKVYLRCIGVEPFGDEEVVFV